MGGWMDELTTTSSSSSSSSSSFSGKADHPIAGLVAAEEVLGMYPLHHDSP